MGQNKIEWGAAFSEQLRYSRTSSTETYTANITFSAFILCLCGALSEAFSAIELSDAGANPVGSTFNIQNSIPHKSQKPREVPETNRAKEFQRGTAGVPESTKEGATGLSEGSDIGLGCGNRAFESHYSDQNPSEIVDFRGIFLFFAYCGAEFDTVFLRDIFAKPQLCIVNYAGL